MLDWVLHSLQVGAVYGALAAGFSLYFGAMRLINLSHGDVFTAGAFAALLIHNWLGGGLGLVGFLILVVAASVTGCVLGPLIELVAYRRIRDREPYVLLLTSVAVSIILREGLALLYPDGANPQSFPDPFPTSLQLTATLSIRGSRLVATTLLMVLAAALVVLLQKTALGRRLRAVSQDPTAAAMIGINVDQVMTAAFALASALACVAGVLYGMVYEQIKYDMGLLLGLRGFAGAVVGGISRIHGAILGGFLLAGIEMGAARLLPGGSGYRDVVVFIILILVLATRPQGVWGRSRRDIDTSLTRRSDARSVF